MQLIRAIIIVCALLASTPAMSADYYIAQTAAGSGNGSDCANADALADLTWGAGNMVAPGDTLHLCGTLTSALTVGASGTAGNVITITFEEDAKFSSAYWAHSNLTVLSGAINADGKSYIVVDGGTNGVIENTANGSDKANQQKTSAIHFMNGAEIEIKNLTIQNLFNSIGAGLDPSDYGMAVALYKVNHVSVHDNTITYAPQGIYWASDGNDTVNIYNNTITYTGQGVVLGCSTDSGGGADTANVYGNTINDCVPWNYNDGIKAFCRNAADDKFTNLKIYNNTIGPNIGDATHASSGHIYTNWGWFDTPLIYNNVVIGDADETVSAYVTVGGRNTTRAVNAGVYNNTIYTTGPDKPLFYVSYNATGNSIQNNIAYAPNMGANAAAIMLDENCTLTVSDYNDWYLNSGAPKFYENGGYLTYVQWKAAHPTFDGHSITTDPSLSVTYEPDAADDPVVGTGTTIASFSTDKAGVNRPQGTAWDIGAYEYIGVPTYTITNVGATGCTNNPASTSFSVGTVEQTMTVTDAYGYDCTLSGCGGTFAAGTLTYTATGNCTVTTTGQPHFATLSGTGSVTLGGSGTACLVDLVKITYDGNGSDGGAVPVSPSYCPSLTATVLDNTGTLTKSGYTFSKWNTAADGSGTDYDPADTFTISGNTTLYAQWAFSPLTITTAAYTDDLRGTGGSIWAIGGWIIGDGGGPYTSTFRFPNVTVSAGTAITNSTITFYATANDSLTDCKIRIYGNAVDNATAPADWAAMEALSLTTAYTDWTVPAWSSGTKYTSPDVSGIINEIKSRPGWASGNAIMFIIRNNGSTNAAYRDGLGYGEGAANPDQYPTLYIE